VSRFQTAGSFTTGLNVPAACLSSYSQGMAPKPKHPPGPPMTLGNMRELGVHHLIGFCLNDARRHSALIDVSAYPADTEVPSFQRRHQPEDCQGARSNCAALFARPRRRGHRMRRRAFIAGLGSAAAWPAVASAQESSAKRPVIAVMSLVARERNLHMLDAFERD
jgi:hypothetical protein